MPDTVEDPMNLGNVICAECGGYRVTVPITTEALDSAFGIMAVHDLLHELEADDGR